MEEYQEKIISRRNILPLSIIISALLISGALFYGSVTSKNKTIAVDSVSQIDSEEVIPTKGFVLPIKWDGLGSKLVEAGVIDKTKFDQLYSERGGLSADDQAMIYSGDSQKIVITPQNANLVLNLLWAVGLANKNEILETGPMSDSRYGEAGQFASTGGWTLSIGNPMDHYSKHKFITLTSAQQELVNKVSAGIYRPCCDNSVYFPDCNHGMAMLGLLEIMSAQGATESEMYKVALQVNAYWFPGTYLNIADFLKTKGIDWKDVDPKEILGASYSSASGYKAILQQINPSSSGGGSSCSA